MEFSTVVKPFDELTPAQLYAILRLRNEVFVVEQNCVFQDADNKDPHCNHLMLFNEDELMAYARIVPAGIAYEEMSIGRVVTSPKARGTGAGRVLMTKAIELCYEILGAGPIRIGAQCYIKAFYASLGFVETGEPYDEDGILHIEMIK
jgi:ElaA protein